MKSEVNKMLTINEIIEGLKYHNRWRRGADVEMLNPSELGELIDGAISILEQRQGCQPTPPPIRVIREGSDTVSYKW